MGTLENSASERVPKVQGAAESLRQKDRATISKVVSCLVFQNSRIKRELVLVKGGVWKTDN